MPGQKPTIDDVASLAGVGRTTVSRVLNNGPNVRPEVRERVQRAVEMLDYKVNLQARNLAGGTSRQLVLIHASALDDEPNSYYYSGLEIGALRACATQGFHLVTHNVNQNSADPAQQILTLMDDGQFEGIILTPPFSDDVDLIAQLNARNCPVVCVSAGQASARVASAVGIDDAQAAFEITNHLIGLGHRKFGFIKGLSGHVAAEGRFDGFLRALEASGIDPATAIVERGNFTFKSGIECAQRVLERRDRPTALLCANDDMAAGALLAIHKMGLEIPQDVSVTGFDDTPVSEIVWPPLTTVHQPIRTMGHRAVDILVGKILGPDRATPPGFDAIPFRIVRRESTAALR